MVLAYFYDPSACVIPLDLDLEDDNLVLVFFSRG